jgi:hypothetical protein
MPSNLQINDYHVTMYAQKRDIDIITMLAYLASHDSGKLKTPKDIVQHETIKTKKHET